MTISIDNLSEEERIKFNHKIVERQKFLETLHTYHEMMQFITGEQIAFEPPGKKRQIGTQIQFNLRLPVVSTRG